MCVNKISFDFYRLHPLSPERTGLPLVPYRGQRSPKGQRHLKHSANEPYPRPMAASAFQPAGTPHPVPAFPFVHAHIFGYTNISDSEM
jgi:hypothetical protein